MQRDPHRSLAHAEEQPELRVAVRPRLRVPSAPRSTTTHHDPAADQRHAHGVTHGAVLRDKLTTACHVCAQMLPATAQHNPRARDMTTHHVRVEAERRLLIGDRAGAVRVLEQALRDAASTRERAALELARGWLDEQVGAGPVSERFEA